jgi:LuxR family maltose regulon positive regulatory protein
MVVLDQAGLRSLPGAIAVHRAGLARVHGDVPGTITHARRALELAGPDDHRERGAAAALLGLAHWTRGDLEAAHREYDAARAALQRAGHHADTLGCSIALADLEIARGRLREAMGTYERGLQVATAPGGTVLRGAADMHVGLGELFRERGDLDAARAHLRAGEELGEHTGLPQNPYRLRVAKARLCEAEGDLDGALVLLEEADRRYTTDFSPDVRPVPALRARVRIAQGEWTDALRWAREHELSVEDELSYLREYGHVTLARALLAQYRTERGERPLRDATALLAGLLRAAEDGGRTGTVIEVLVLQALAASARGDVPAALPALRRALALAEPEGAVRVFAEEGPPMAALLRAVGDDVVPGQTRRLLAALGATPPGGPARPGPVDALSPRELDVLRLLGTELDGPAIARELFVSLNTVRTHTKAVYAKLGVTNRRAAVRRAQELQLP